MPAKRSRKTSGVSANPKYQDGVFTLDSGLTLMIKPLPALLLEKAASESPHQRYQCTSTSGRVIRKRTRPARRDLAAVQEHQSAQSAMMVFTALALGTEIIDENGDVMASPPDDGWKDFIMAIGGVDWRKPTYIHNQKNEVDLPEAWAEKCSYLMYYVMTADDISSLFEVLVGGEGYNEALKSFPSDVVGNTNT